jgi:RNA polymerase sigma factor (sigma-70 family)
MPAGPWQHAQFDASTFPSPGVGGCDVPMPTETMEEAGWLTPTLEESSRLPDAALVAAVVDGDPGASNELYRRYHDAVRRICGRWLQGDAEGVADAIQETFARIVAVLPKLRHTEQFDRYINRTAKRVCIDEIRRRGTHDAVLRTAGVAGRLPSDPIDILVERRMVASDILDGLSARDAALLSMRYIEDRPIASVAAEFHYTSGSAKVMLSRAMRRARDFAASTGLSALAPVPMSRRWRAWVESAGQLPAVGSSHAAAFLVPLVAVLAFAAGEHVQSLERAARPSAAKAAAFSPHENAADDFGASPRGDAASSANPFGERRGATQPRTDREKRNSAPPGSVPLAPAAASVPIAGRNVGTAPPSDRKVDYRYGMEFEGMGQSRRVEVVVMEDEREFAPMHDRLCAAAGSVGEPAYCRGAADRSTYGASMSSVNQR